MNWPQAPPDLSCMENLWGIVKQDFYKNGNQFFSKVELCQVIEAVPMTTIEKLTKLIYDRLSLVLQKSGGFIDK